MKPMGRLKWVPMLIKAYVDAQTQLERTRAREPAQTVDGRDDSRASQPGRPENGREISRPRTQGEGARAKKARLQSAPRAARPNYQLLYKELRETKERLDHLEGISQQIEDLQFKLDRHLAELSRKLEPPSPEDNGES